MPDKKWPPDVLRLTQLGLKVRPPPVSFFLDDCRMLFVVVAILMTKTQEELRMLLAAVHTTVADEGRRSYFVVQADLNTSGDVLDKARKILERSQVVGLFCPWQLLVNTSGNRVSEHRDWC